MALVEYTTLMVLLAGSNLDFSNLWGSTGGYNDQTGTKHTLPIRDIISGGNFRSVLVDNWTTKPFDTVSVSGMNNKEDIFWEAEFNVTDTTADIASWLSLGTLTYASTFAVNQTDIVWGGGTNYLMRFTNVNDGMTWFAVTSGNLSYSGMPRIFAHAKPLISFTEPAVYDGYRGCWLDTELDVATVGTTTSDMVPARCINMCWDKANVAFLRLANACFCANTTSPTIPEDSGYCSQQCVGDNNYPCGSSSSSYGSAYHVQGSKPLGEQSITLVYNGTSTRDVQDMLINEDDAAYNAATGPHYITEISVRQSLLTVTYTVMYSSENCSTVNVTMSLKVLNSNPFAADNTLYKFTILKVRCIVLRFSAPVDAVIEMYGPEVNGFVNVPALVIRGKQIIPDATTTGTSQTSSIITTTAVPTTISQSSTTGNQTTSISTTDESPTSTTSPPSTALSTQASTAATNMSLYDNTTLGAPDSLTTTTALSSSATTSTTLSSSVATSTTLSSSANASTTLSSSVATSTTLSSSVATSTTLSSSATASTTLSSSATASTTMSSSATASTTLSSICLCNCNETIQQLNMTAEELKVKIAEIQKRLLVNVSQLSSTIRRLTSAKDERPSAISIGSLGIGVLVFMLGSIIFIDSSMLLRDLKKLFHNLRHSVLCSSSVRPRTT